MFVGMCPGEQLEDLSLGRGVSELWQSLGDGR
jgi:hypothetical protein